MPPHLQATHRYITALQSKQWHCFHLSARSAVTPQWKLLTGRHTTHMRQNVKIAGGGVSGRSIQTELFHTAELITAQKQPTESRGAPRSNEGIFRNHLSNHPRSAYSRMCGWLSQRNRPRFAI